ncbi:hypothetical protein U2I54_27040 [Bacillus pseudomycoides]|uniref:Uncharacterized protein n=1 Tax=Bacillus bingmayongensis TaxID=1150157 RepID=A0ABU5K4L4_9BACI|nr:hypothetical protein [Bacillus pseudomycoides]
MNSYKLVNFNEIENLRKKWNVPETHTSAVGKTDVKGLEDLSFEGGSPKVRKEAGLPSLDKLYPNHEIKAPYNREIRGHAQFMDHAEEGIVVEFEDAVKKAAFKLEGVKRTLNIINLIQMEFVINVQKICLILFRMMKEEYLSN